MIPFEMRKNFLQCRVIPVNKLFLLAFLFFLSTFFKLGGAQANTDLLIEEVQFGNHQVAYRAPSSLQDVKLFYAGAYSGSSLFNPVRPELSSPDGSIDPDKIQNLKNELTLGYLVGKDWMVGVMNTFLYYPFASQKKLRNNSYTMLAMHDPSLVLDVSNIIHKNHWKLGAGLQFQFSVTKLGLKSQDLLAAVELPFRLEYAVPKSYLTLKLNGSAKKYVPRHPVKKSIKSYKVELSPNLSYAFKENLKFTFWINLISATRKIGTPFFSGFQNDPVEIAPGVKWNITQNWSINPYFTFYAGRPTFASSSIRAVVSATFL